MQKHRFAQSVLALVALFALILCQGTWVLAGTTGSITGTVTDKATNAPIAGAKVTAASPSQVASTTTDASGHYGLLSLAPDTYTLSVDKSGYQATSLAGVTVQSDQNAVITLPTNKELRTIARTTARSSGSLVRAGVTTDVYNLTPAQQAAAAPLGGGNNLNSAYSAIQAAPGVLVPISDSPGWGQSINIRGGDYTQTGNEVDGVPINRAFDQYSTSPLSNLGNAEVQVYTGNQPSDAQANGLAGFVNQVIKTGTYPGFTNSQLGVGGPGYYHKFSIETGGALKNRNFSYYLGFLGYNQQNRFVDQFNGAGQAYRYGTIYNYVASGCDGAHPASGCYINGPNAGLNGSLPLGPNGYALSPVFWGAIPATSDREGIANFHIAVPHAHDGLKDDVQLLYNTGETYNTPNDSLGSFNQILGNVVNGTVGPYANDYNPNNPNGANVCPNFTGVPVPAGSAPVACGAPVNPVYIDQNVYTGPRYAALTAGNLGSIRNLFFTGSNQQRAFGAPVPPNQIDSETTGFTVAKVQYQHNFSTNAYARVYGYTNYSDRIDNGIVGLYQNFTGSFSQDYLISSHTRGVAALFADQIDPHNLIQFDGAYTYSNTSRFRNDTAAGAGEAPVAYLVSSANPTAGCYGVHGKARVFGPSTCAKALTYSLPPVGGTSLMPSATAYAIGSPGLAGVNCGGAPCEYFAVNTGPIAASNNVRPAFTNFAISDNIKPNDRLTINAALRFEDFTYNLLPTSNPGNQLLVNDYNNSHCVAGPSVTPRAIGTACPTGSLPTALTAVSPPKEDYGHIFSPRFGLTYQVDPNTVLRASYGRFTQPSTTAAVDATNVQAGPPSAQFFANFGFPSYARSVEPEISYNSDLSLEHAFPRQDLSLKLTPFYRSTVNEFASILVNPKTNFVADINGLNRKASGVEFALTKGNFDRDGFAAQLAYTFTYATAHFKVFPNGGSLVASSNGAIQQYNGYTKVCATNPTAKQCGPTFFCSPQGAGFGTPACTGSTGAAPCYTTAGVPDAACAAGSVANPYWNSSTFGLLDPGAAYFPYNCNLGAGASGCATSYIVPHVASLILNYKHGPLTITPSVQFQGGSRYGSPFVAQGIAPDTCSTVLAGAVAGDPRYTNGSPGGGSPYNASSCAVPIAIPNPETKHFDGIAEYVQPNLIATNLSVNYDFTKQFSINVIAANIFNRCFGGSKVPWQQGNLGCAYSNTGSYVANFYNPGDAIQPGFEHSYSPVLGGALQSVAASSPLPFELYVNLNAHI